MLQNFLKDLSHTSIKILGGAFGFQHLQIFMNSFSMDSKLGMYSINRFELSFSGRDVNSESMSQNYCVV